MQDFMRWALPIYTAFGITVRIHLLFFLITLPMCIRLINLNKEVWWFDIFMITTGIVFLSVLLHEYGHSFSARWVGGSSDDILLWPLGGLATVEVPHNPRAHAIVTGCGPLVNVVICAICAIGLLAGGFSPVKALNPFGLLNVYTTPAYHLSNGREYSNNYAPRFYKAGTAESVKEVVKDPTTGETTVKGAPFEKAEQALLPVWAVWLYRFMFINWWLFLFNVLLPAYPLDGGRLLHAFLWQRGDHRSATITCCYVGLGTAVVLIAVTILTNEASFIGLALFMGFHCYQTLRMEQETERGAFGYDFSAGYTSLERDEPKPRVNRPGPIRRWLDARKARRIQREQQQQADDDRRMDDLLDKISRQGKNSLTAEEQRFMERVSARYRNK